MPLNIRLAVCTIAASAFMSTVQDADGRAYRASAAHSSTYHVTKSRTPSNVARDSDGRIKRSLEAKHEFKNAHPCPTTGKSFGRCPGYVIDHVTALKRGGADKPSNMQWQTIQASKLKDKTE